MSRSRHSPAQALRAAICSLLGRILKASARKLLLQAPEHGKVSEVELAQIRKLLDEVER